MIKLFFLILLGMSILKPGDVFAGNTCAYVSRDNYACGAWDQCGTGASCGKTCTTSTPGTVNCGGGSCTYQCSGEGPSRIAMNGIVYQPPTGKRWVKEWLLCNQSYLGVNVESFDKDKNKIEASFNCNFESNGDGGGHFDTYAVVSGEKTYLKLSLPPSFSCSDVSWEIIDRLDLYDTSDDIRLATGSGCEAEFTADVASYDWKYGANFFLNETDTTAPTCTIPTFTPSSIVNGPITATGTASDINGIAKTGVYVYQGNNSIKTIQDNNTANTETSLSKTWDLKNDVGSVVADGIYQMHFNWYDPSNNFKQCKADFTIDRAAPTKPGNPVVPACLAIGGSTSPITFTGSTDLGSGMSHYVVNVDEGNNNTVNFTGFCNASVNYNNGDICVSTNSTSYSYSFRDDTTYRIWIEAFDNAGNKNWSDELIYNPQTPPPAPSDLIVSRGLDSRINLSWRDNSNETYNAEDKFVVTKDGAWIADVLGSNPQAQYVSKSFVDYSDSCNGNDHTYSVNAYNNSCGPSPSVSDVGNCLKLFDNSWWQVFNGGVHSNRGITLDEIPSADFVVGDASTTPHPIILNQNVATFNSYGLLSSVLDDIDISDGNAGVDGHDYFVEQTNEEMINPANITLFYEIKIAGSSWTDKSQSAISSIGSAPNPSYFVRDSSETVETVNSTINYNDNKIIAVIFNQSNSTLTITKDIVDNSVGRNKYLLFLVHGDVIIDSSVDQIDAFIVSSGRITVESAGANLDDVFFVKGGLYAEEILFNRDLKNQLPYVNKPAEVISYNHNLLAGGTNFPIEIKETPVYWVFTD